MDVGIKYYLTRSSKLSDIPVEVGNLIFVEDEKTYIWTVQMDA